MKTYNLVRLLPSLFPEANYLSLDSDISSWDKVVDAHKSSDLTLDQVVRTKCRLTADTLSYLMSFQPSDMTNMTSEHNDALWIRLRGLDKNDQSTHVSHALVILETPDGHLLADSYIGCREITCRIIDPDEFLSDILEMQEKYRPETWKELTGCSDDNSDGPPIDHVLVVKNDYSYLGNPESITERLNELNQGYNNTSYGHKNYKEYFKKINSL